MKRWHVRLAVYSLLTAVSVGVSWYFYWDATRTIEPQVNYASTPPDGVNNLDRFMARNPAALVTIEIAGEPAIKRTIYGRLSRERPPVVLRLLTPDDIRATTQPTRLFND